jgi:O-antigen ligase
MIPHHGTSTAPTHRALETALRLTFYAFVFLLPVETVNIGISVTAVRIVGYLLCLLALLHPGLCFRRPPGAFWCFTAYVCIYGALGLLQDDAFFGEIGERFLTLTQLLVLLWLSFNLMRNPQIAREALATLAVSCAFFALLSTAGLGSGSSTERTAALGQNPNEVAGFYALGLIALVGLTYRRTTNVLRYREIVWVLVAVLGLAIVRTGSRGGALALGVGLLAFVLSRGSARVKVRNVCLVLLLVGAFAGFSYYSETSGGRWAEVLATGKLAHREQLYPAAQEMFLEKPLAGWGPIVHLYELGARTRDAGWHDSKPWRDTHNLYLYVLTATGLLGAAPFFLGLWLCLRSAWRARLGPESVLPLALMLTILALNMSGTWMHLKLNWLVLAYILASAAPLLPRQVKRVIVPLRERASLAVANAGHV